MKESKQRQQFPLLRHRTLLMLILDERERMKKNERNKCIFLARFVKFNGQNGFLYRCCDDQQTITRTLKFFSYRTFTTGYCDKMLLAFFVVNMTVFKVILCEMFRLQKERIDKTKLMQLYLLKRKRERNGCKRIGFGGVVCC